MVENAAGRLSLRLPEGIAFSLPLAGPGARFLAWIIDGAAVIVLTMIVNIASQFIGLVNIDVARAFSIASYFVISLGYGILLEWFWRGQTLGKRLLHLRVMDAEGLNLRFDQVFLRNILRFIDRLPLLYLVGGVALFLSPHNQRLGDLAANTVVVRSRLPEEPSVAQGIAGKYNSFRAYPHLEARLRQNISPDEARIALEAVHRRDRLSADARLALFCDLADHFRAIVSFPDEATLGITDEQYVRNIVDSVYNTRSARRGKSSEGTGDRKEKTAAG